MTTPTIAAPPQIVSDTLKAVEAYKAFYATVNGYQEPDRTSLADVIAARDSAAAVLETPAAQMEYQVEGRLSGVGLTEGRTFRLGVSPGIISCRSTDLNKREKTIVKEPGKRSRTIDMANTFEGESRVSLETGEIFDDFDGPVRAEITGWSRKSRAHMSKTLASLDYSEWLQGDGALAMVTLTLPGKWQILCPDGKSFKALIEKFRRRWTRAVGDWRLLWKLEFQGRGAPHWHALIRVPALVKGEIFERWLSRTWADVVSASDEIDGLDSHGNPDSEFRRHLRAGTGVDFSGKEFSDPRRIPMYFAGHSAKSQDGKEYQHVVPEEWQQPGKGPGRFWGFCGLEKAYVELDITQKDYDRLRRELRKLARARAWTIAVKRSHGASRRESRPRADVHTITAPKVRKSNLGGRGGQNGGWVLLNDALPVLAAYASWLSPGA